MTVVLDSYIILLDAIERLKSLDREKIAKAIRNTKNFPGVSGYITVGNDGNTIKSVLMLRIRNEQIVYIDRISLEMLRK